MDELDAATSDITRDPGLIPVPSGRSLGMYPIDSIPTSKELIVAGTFKNQTLLDWPN